jgi:cytochrome c peroxidase
MEADERFGKRWTGTDDFDEDGVSNELTAGDLSALVAFQATLPSPVIEVPQDKRWVEAAAHGSAVFDTLKCSSCHIRALPLKSATFTDPGPYDAAGTLSTQDVDAPVAYDLSKLDWAKGLERDKDGNIMVPLFGDLKRHVIADQTVAALGNELLAQRFVERNEFMTAELWGVGNTAPYGHRGDMTTLDEVIRAHGGEARASRDAYIAASNEDRSALIAYLKTLVIKP